MTKEIESDNIVKLSASEAEKTTEKRNLKILKKIWKKYEKTVDKVKQFVVWYTSCRRESEIAWAVARFKKIKNGIRKKWDFIWHNANENVISVNFSKKLEVTFK